MASSAPIIVDFPGHDRIEARLESGRWSLKVVGCREVEFEIQNRLKNEADLTKWSLPSGTGHGDLLIRELILRARGEWAYPYEHLELCHCRSVPTEIVDQAILSGAHEPKQVSTRTSASTACGTCRPDVQKIINYRLGK
jgi:bacterioferritin-associated ferredoxin